MPNYVYIIQSEVNNSYYKGYSENPVNRLAQHNNRKSPYTSHLIPWRLVYIEECESKAIALKRERNIKKATLERIEAMISHPKNILHRFPIG